MVTFKTIKYKHKKIVDDLIKKVESEQATDDEVDAFIVSLVASWDFMDVDTGEPIQVSLEGVGELSIEQYNSLMEEFNAEMSQGVKKKSEPKSSSGSRQTKKAESRQR